ncbi:MAG: DUF512 domain-containing protein [Lachnospiraceae bacterium]|uniref:DUF512 domain-containing protein n=1 Tax=Candidatus Weimeria bifida TaxID=2599074 RepID=A0A6N7IWA0_9FIRM|nr:DUF512 domain-containing protein [Candidatus Weimeria bifida]RRF96103.1 MAG: DUF512 domain-containing protein [Lachnospiraceae bacterium]
MSNDTHEIESVRRGSLAERAGIRPGDTILKAGGKELKDIFDYYYYEENNRLDLLIRHPDGREQNYVIEKSDEDTDIGITFKNGLLDNYRSCSNHCMFCFIDQMPPGMRETLYFKDDDTRLSFLQGNYVTLTNMSDEELQRVIDYRLSPINVSVHTTNPELRVRMLANKNAGRVMERLKKISDAGLTMNTQIVLCKGINDGKELDRTIEDLLSFYPQVTSLSVVPVGLTKFRKGLYNLKPFERADAIKVIDQIEGWQKKIFEKYGEHFVFASDEWYLTAGRDLPEASVYDGFGQLENGVGMIRLLIEEFKAALEKEGPHFFRHKSVTIATGVLAAPFLRQLADLFMKKYPRIKVEVVTIINHYFGEQITVSGLITGIDLKTQLLEHGVNDRLLIPVNMLRSNEEVFLDDMTVGEVSDALQVPVTVVKSSGQDLLDALLGKEE